PGKTLVCSLVACRRRLRCSSRLEQHRAELPARGDAELGEDLAQVPFNRTWAQEQLRADLRVREPVPGEAGDLFLLRGQLIAGLGTALAHLLARGDELPAGPLGVRRVAHSVEHDMREAELLAGIDAAVLAAQPLAVDEMRP